MNDDVTKIDPGPNPETLRCPFCGYEFPQEGGVCWCLDKRENEE